jgi:preprotein translocase subunit YajC
MFISEAFAQTAAAGAPPSAVSQIFPFLLILVVFYFFMIRPQQKRYKEHKAMLEAIAKGDKIVTSGGLIGKVTKVSDTTLNVQIAEGTVVEVMRSMVANVLDTKVKVANDN